MASPEEMTEIGITNLIPQREPFIMISKLVSAEEGTTITTFHISEDNPMVEDHALSAGGMIENIAQTAAAGMGYKCLKEKSIPPVGFIGGIKNLEIYSQPSVGTEITTHVHTEHEVLNARIIKGQIHCCNKLMAVCEMKIFILSDMKA